MRIGTAALACLLSSCTAAAPSAKATAPRPISAAARGSAVVIDPRDGAAVVADADGGAIHRVDLATGSIASTPLGGSPAELARIAGADGEDDRWVVTLRDRNEVELFVFDAAGQAHMIAAADVATDPWGVAVTPQGEVLVTSAWGRALTALDRDTLETRWSVELAREPRGVSVAPDGRHAYVTHLVGDAITVVDLEPPDAGARAPNVRRLKALDGSYRNRLDRAVGAETIRPTAALAYASVLSPSGARLFVPHVIEENGSSTAHSLPGAYGGVPIEEETSTPSVAVVLTEGERVLGARFEGTARDKSPSDGAAPIRADDGVDVALAPLAAPCRQSTDAALADDSLLVTSQGTNELVELDARAIDPATMVRRVYPVGEGPRGVDVDRATRAAVVWNQLSHDLAIVWLDSHAVERVAVASDPLPREVAAGRRLFMTERDRRISRDGRACAGCHPEGRDDGVVWKLGAGPRQTPTIVGRLSRGPFGWEAKHRDLEGNMRETVSRLGGTGLPDLELGYLARFVREGLVAPRRTPQPSALVERGRALFTSEAVGCSGCHRLETDASDRDLHDVGSRSSTDHNTTFRTPPLLFVGNTAPYFHDGRYATLEALLEDNLDRMGQTSPLRPEDLRALAAFLRTL